MIMSAVHDPLARKRRFPEATGPEPKRNKNEEGAFSDKMYAAYVKAAFESLDRVRASLIFSVSY